MKGAGGRFWFKISIVVKAWKFYSGKIFRTGRPIHPRQGSRAETLILNGVQDVRQDLQRAFPVHLQLGPQHPGRSHPERSRQGRFRAFSAGSQPAGQVNPIALELLQRNRISTEGLRSRTGTSLRRRMRRTWTSSSPSATRPPASCARCGPASR
jgi:hypothetical protein